MKQPDKVIEEYVNSLDIVTARKLLSFCIAEMEEQELVAMYDICEDDLSGYTGKMYLGDFHTCENILTGGFND